MVVVGSAGADFGGKVDWQSADDRVAGGNLLRVKMGELLVDGDALPSGPRDSAGVAGDEPGAHAEEHSNERQG